MITRGISKFEVDSNEHILFTEENFEKLRKMFLDRNIINGDLLGPGDPGDFDTGSWHILCHLVAACAVYRKSNKFIWMEISHVPLVDTYTATVTIDEDNEPVATFPLLSEQGQLIIKDAELMGFVEGSSLGHISAGDVKDPLGVFNTCTRQEYDQSEESVDEGGRVWEHWTTTRNITQDAPIGSSVLKAYLSIVSQCGGRFVSIVARGRTEYHHPEQLKALMHYGFITEEEGLIDIVPKPIPHDIELALYSSNPRECVNTVKKLPWDKNKISYFMFERSINKWNFEKI